MNRRGRSGLQCQACGKTVLSQSRARKLAARLRKESLGLVPWRAYYDPECGVWHLTSHEYSNWPAADPERRERRRPEFPANQRFHGTRYRCGADGE